MDTTFLSAITEIQQHIGIINAEIGKAQTDIMWLKASFWELMGYVRIITGGVIVGIIVNIWNLLTIKKNGRK